MLDSGVNINIAALEKVKELKDKKKKEKDNRKWKRKKLNKEQVLSTIDKMRGKSSSISQIFQEYNTVAGQQEEISQSTFYRYLKEDLGARYKKGKLRNQRVKYDSTQAKLVGFHLMSQKYLVKGFKFVFIDEATFKSDDIRQMIWTLPEESDYVLKPANSFSVSAILAVSNEGCDFFHLNSFTTNGEGFTDFFIDLVEELEKGTFIKQKSKKTQFLSLITLLITTQSALKKLLSIDQATSFTCLRIIPNSTLLRTYLAS